LLSDAFWGSLANSSNADQEGSMKSVSFAAAALAFILAAGAASAQGVDKLYVIDCGWAHAVDQSRWSPGINVGVPIDVSGNCYLIHHTQGGYLLWDTMRSPSGRTALEAASARRSGTATRPCWRSSRN
jgi:hypothetical protein